MDDSCGHGDDDLNWGLACPPLDEEAFNFEPNDDFIFDDILLNEQEIVRRRPVGVGKGKDIRILGLLLDCDIHSKTPKNQPHVIDQPVVVDYEFKLEASRKKLREEYDRLRDAKRRKQIQVIDVQKLVPPPRSKSKGKPSFRQRLMATGGIRKSNKKFPPYTTLCAESNSYFVSEVTLKNGLLPDKLRLLIMWNPRLISEEVGIRVNARNMRDTF